MKKIKSTYLKLQFWLLAVFLSTSLLLFSCRDPLLQSGWITSPPSIDGNNSDWKSIPAYKLQSWDASLKLSNDAQFLYLLLSFEDPMLTGRLRNGGISLEFTGQESKDSLLRLRYTGVDSLYRQPEPKDSFWEYLNADQKKTIREQQEILRGMITVLQKGRRIRVPANGEQGPAAARIFIKGSASYEFKIPLRSDASNLYAIDAVPRKTITVTIALADQRPENFYPMMAGSRWSNRPREEASEIRIRVHLADQK
jgi:hypothetical protein